MRERKYRIWDGTLHKMIMPEDNIFPAYKIHMNGSVTCGDVWCTGEVIVQDWTGLKDKNGTEIYEGDIVTGWKNIDYGGNEAMKVEYVTDDNCGFWPFLGASDCCGCSPLLSAENCKVIGNQYENPELLKEAINA